MGIVFPILLLAASIAIMVLAMAGMKRKDGRSMFVQRMVVSAALFAIGVTWLSVTMWP